MSNEGVIFLAALSLGVTLGAACVGEFGGPSVAQIRGCEKKCETNNGIACVYNDGDCRCANSARFDGDEATP